MINSTQQPQPVLAEFNPFEPSQANDPYPMYAHAREHAPIFFSPVLNMWVVTRHEDISEILLDPLRFSSRQAVDAVSEMPPEVLEVLAAGLPQRDFLVNYDPPMHTSLRRLCNKAFSPQRVAAMEPRIRELTNALVDGFVKDGTADLVTRFTLPLPRIVIAEIVGVPHSDIDKFGKWAEEWTWLFIAGLPLEQQLVAARSLVALQNYTATMIDDRREHTQDDFLSDLVNARMDDGSLLDTYTIIGLVNSFLIAGHVTTTDMISNVLLFLLKQPELLQAWSANLDLRPGSLKNHCAAMPRCRA